MTIGYILFCYVEQNKIKIMNSVLLFFLEYIMHFLKILLLSCFDIFTMIFRGLASDINSILVSHTVFISIAHDYTYSKFSFLKEINIYQRCVKLIKSESKDYLSINPFKNCIMVIVVTKHIC